jgi:thioredoxin reductase (NADPH)
VCVVAGANSAGQAVLHLARFAARGHAAHTGESLVASVSDYLITQLKATPSIGVRLRTRVAGGHGQARLEALTLEEVRTGQREQVPAAAVFVMIGAEAHTMAPRPRQAERSWIHPDRPRRSPGAWPLPRPPLPFKTSLPGDQDAGRLDPGNLRAASRIGRSDRLQLGPPGAQAIRVCRK